MYCIILVHPPFSEQLHFNSCSCLLFSTHFFVLTADSILRANRSYSLWILATRIVSTDAGQADQLKVVQTISRSDTLLAGLGYCCSQLGARPALLLEVTWTNY